MSVKMSVKTSVKILELMKVNPEITRPVPAKEIDKSIRSVERTIEKLKKRTKLSGLVRIREVIGRFRPQLHNSDKAMKAQKPRLQTGY